MKNLNLLLLVFAVACGNPHLTKIDGLGSKNIPFIGTPDTLTLLGLQADDGFNVITEESSISKLVEIQNLDQDKDWSVEMKFEKGTQFRFTGNDFPGTGGNCALEMKGSQKCSVNVEFFTDTPSFHADNLIITYTSLKDPKDSRTLHYPLRGERIEKKKTVYAVSVRTLNNQKILDFGKSDLDNVLDSRLIIKNEGNTPITFNVQFELNESFSFNGKTFPGSAGTCKSELLAQEECLIDVSFESKVTGLHQDQITVDYQKGKTTFPVIGEKKTDKKQGPLVSSEVFSNTVDFGKVRTGLTVNKQFEIQNLGEVAYNLKATDLQGQYFSFSGGKFPGVNGTCTDILLPGSCIIELSYSPVVVGNDTGSFKLLTKEGDSVALTLKGSGVTAQVCESFNEYLIIPEKSYPAHNVIFPYVTSFPGTTAKLSILYGLEVNGYIKSLDRYVVADGMVYTTYKLPKMEGDIVSMNFGVKVLKVIQDSYKDTESLCLSSRDIRKCSGHEFSLASWQKLKNPNFWNIHSTPVSERYERQFAAGEYKCGAFQCMDLNTEYELSDIFELSKQEMKTLRNDGTFSLIFSDDTRMHKMPRLYVKTSVKRSCE